MQLSERKEVATDSSLKSLDIQKKTTIQVGI